MEHVGEVHLEIYKNMVQQELNNYTNRPSVNKVCVAQKIISGVSCACSSCSGTGVSTTCSLTRDIYFV